MWVEAGRQDPRPQGQSYGLIPNGSEAHGDHGLPGSLGKVMAFSQRNRQNPHQATCRGAEISGPSGVPWSRSLPGPSQSHEGSPAPRTYLTLSAEADVTQGWQRLGGPGWPHVLILAGGARRGGSWWVRSLGLFSLGHPASEAVHRSPRAKPFIHPAAPCPQMAMIRDVEAVAPQCGAGPGLSPAV